MEEEKSNEESDDSGLVHNIISSLVARTETLILPSIFIAFVFAVWTRKLALKAVRKVVMTP